MKLTELQDSLEELETNLLIIYETVSMLETSANADILDVNNISWFLMGITKNLNAAVKETGNLINATIEINSKIKEL